MMTTALQVLLIALISTGASLATWYMAGCLVERERHRRVTMRDCSKRPYVLVVTTTGAMKRLYLDDDQEAVVLARRLQKLEERRQKAREDRAE